MDDKKKIMNENIRKKLNKLREEFSFLKVTPGENMMYSDDLFILTKIAEIQAEIEKIKKDIDHLFKYKRD